MGDGNFTPAEAKVLVELMAHQHEADRVIAERLGMAPSNFAVVKKRLVGKGVLEERIGLDIGRLPEAHVAAFVWGEYNRPIRHRYEGVFAAKLRPQFPISETMGGKDWVLNIHYFRSFEEAETARLKFSELLEGAIKPQVARYTWRSVPLSHLSAYSFPGRLTRYAFTHELEAVTSLKKAGIVEHASSERQAKLNETEKKVLLALRKYPGMKRSEIARKVGIRQSSLSEVSKRLGQKEVIAATRMPDPRKLPGRDIAAFTWIDLAQPMPKEEYDECIMEMINSTPQLYSIYFSRTFILMISMFHSLDKAENSNVSTMERFGGNLKTLNFKIVPCEHLQMIHHPQFLEKLLGVSL